MSWMRCFGALILTAFADAGVTDLSVRFLPVGTSRDEFIAPKLRTEEAVAALAAEVR